MTTRFKTGCLADVAPIKEKAKILLITATDVETRALHAHFRPLHPHGRCSTISVANQTYYIGRLGNAKRELEDRDNAFIYVDLSAPFSSERECFRHIIDTAVETRADLFDICKQPILTARQASPLPPYKEHENELRMLLNAVSGKVVIILDEIDSLTKGVFSDKVFAQIRSVYFTRTNYPQFNKLTYLTAGARDLKAATRMARDIVETPLPGLSVTEETQFQTFRLLCALSKGKERERYGFKYVECLKAGYGPKTFDSLDLEILIDIAGAQIRTKKPHDAIKSIGFAKMNKGLLPPEQTADFSAIHLYEMVAYRDSNAKAKLRQAAHETLSFLESLAGQLGQARLINAESLKTIEDFARDNLAPPHGLIEAMPIITARKYGRNERVSVRYQNGTIKTDVKFKTVEADIKDGRCFLVN